MDNGNRDRSSQSSDRDVSPTMKGDIARQMHGDYVGGDKVGYGDITGSKGIAIGRDAQATVNIGSQYTFDQRNDLGRIFAEVNYRIDRRPADPDVDKEELTFLVRLIQQEAMRGEQANPIKFERTLHNLATLAPDIQEFIVACLTDTAARIPDTVRMAANKSRSTDPQPQTVLEFEDVISFVQQNAPDDQTARLMNLLKDLHTEVDRGESANVRQVRYMLEELIRDLPELRKPLWAWLSTTPPASMSLRIVARKLLA